MFIKNICGKEETTKLAESIGCQCGESIKGSGYGKPGLIGNTFPIKDSLKASGAKFDSENKAWIFESWEELEAAIKSVKVKGK